MRIRKGVRTLLDDLCIADLSMEYSTVHSSYFFLSNLFHSLRVVQITVFPQPTSLFWGKPLGKPRGQNNDRRRPPHERSLLPCLLIGLMARLGWIGRCRSQISTRYFIHGCSSRAMIVCWLSTRRIPYFLNLVPIFPSFHLYFRHFLAPLLTYGPLEIEMMISRPKNWYSFFFCLFFFQEQETHLLAFYT